MSSNARFLVVATVVVAAASLALGVPACEAFDPAECDDDVDCGAARVCAAGQCVACDDNADCGAGQFCCGGECLADTEVGRRCGCGPALGGNPGVDCTVLEPAGLCLASGLTASVDTVSQGSCGCGCTAAEGGPICAAPDQPGQAALCSCLENSDCRVPSLDAAGRPHRSTDTCNPSSACVCYAAAATPSACDPDSAAPDCSSAGCVSLLASATDCGVGGRTCLDPATGLGANGSCIEGGCACDHEDDCAGDALNVDACVFLGGAARCVCSGYTRAGDPAPCPMALLCAGATGCSLEGASYASEEALRAAFGLP